jgi:imidazole glycerol-phosphate synthase subunit HisF
MLSNGVNLVKTIKFGRMRNLGNAVQMARVYNSRNVDELIFIDLKATEENREPIFEIITEVANECFMPLTVGGGIHSLSHIEKMLKIGADKICLNSESFYNSDFITKAGNKFGKQCIVVSIDSKSINGKNYLFTNRGLKNTGILTTEWAKKIEQSGAGEIFLNSIDKDGMMEGYDIDLIKTIQSVVSIPVIACGGAGKVQDIIDAVKISKADAVSLASMFHYSGHTSNSIKERMAIAKIPVRLFS